MYLPWCRYLSAQVGVEPQLYADNLKCTSRDPELLFYAARFTTEYVRLVGQEPAPSKCILLSTSREVRRDMKDWVLSKEGDQWSVKFDVRDLGGHLNTTFRGWSLTLAARVRLVISLLALIFVLPLDFHGRVRVVRSMYLPAVLHGIEASLLASESLRRLRSAVRRVVWSRRQPLANVGAVLSLLDVPTGCDPAFCVVWFRFRLAASIFVKSGGFIVCLLWFMRVVLCMVLFIFFLLAPLRLAFSGFLILQLGLDLACLCLVIWLAFFSISRLLFLMLGAIRSLLTFVDGRVF